VTVWQLIALEHPCLLAEETAHPRFGHATRSGSVVLTINTGYE
jgi:hypothetical protein